VLKENYSKHEVLLVGEIIKMVFSGWMIAASLPKEQSASSRLKALFMKSSKMFVLAAIYGAMNILSYVSLRNIGAGMFTIFAQCKILTTATFSAILLRRQYSWARWRALIALFFGVLLFSQPIWSDPDKNQKEGGNAFVGTGAVLIEVTLSGFASIYFEKVIKTDPEQLGIWDRNFQLSLGSCPIYFLFMLWEDGGGTHGLGSGWSSVAWALAFLGAAGGLLVALSIKYGDSILKTLATTGAIVVSSVLDHLFMGGPLTPIMIIAGCNVIIAICNYTFDATPVTEPKAPKLSGSGSDSELMSLTKDMENGDHPQAKPR